MPLYAIDGIAPEIAASAWVAPTAVLIGRVRLLPGASVWWGAVLRGDNEQIVVGAGANVQDNCVCHTDIGAPLTIGAGATVGHAVILHGCTIGDGALIGMGAVVLNHAVIGTAALLGAKSLVGEGKSIADRTLAVGAPARAVRSLSDAEISRIRDGAEQYVANAARFREGCRPA